MNMQLSTPTPQIRPAVPDDASSIASVLYAAFVEYKSSYTPEAFASTTPAADQIQRRLSEGPVWVVLRDESIVGTVAVVPKGESLYVRGMAVLPDARGQKIGELLLAHIESFASARGFKRLLLSTTPFLSSAIRLYERFGFRRISDGPHDLFGTPIFTMEKLINSEPCQS
ncbi:MAG TPA: GNAT family N-acetyltransferase [Pyrinomonadaceae bacterium]|nr:GNAT family N-acetyltransferase [Pyrinomonadaceae bacterium]